MEHIVGKVNIPIYLLGLGAEDNIDLTCENDRMMVDSVKRIGENGGMITTRGWRTTEILAKYGITNVETLGCPSMYSTLNPNFAVNGVNETSDKVALNSDTWANPRFFQPLLFSNHNNI